MLLLRVFNVEDIQTKISDTMMIKFDYVAFLPNITITLKIKVI